MLYFHALLWGGCQHHGIIRHRDRHWYPRGFGNHPERKYSSTLGVCSQEKIQTPNNLRGLSRGFWSHSNGRQHHHHQFPSGIHATSGRGQTLWSTRIHQNLRLDRCRADYPVHATRIDTLGSQLAEGRKQGKQIRQLCAPTPRTIGRYFCLDLGWSFAIQLRRNSQFGFSFSGSLRKAQVQSPTRRYAPSHFLAAYYPMDALGRFRQHFW